MSDKTAMEWLALCDQRKAESERIDADYTYIDYRDTMCSAHPHLAQALRRTVEVLRMIGDVVLDSESIARKTPSFEIRSVRQEARALLRELGVKDDGETNT